jgi:hypothetical protein
MKFGNFDSILMSLCNYGKIHLLSEPRNRVIDPVTSENKTTKISIYLTSINFSDRYQSMNVNYN